MFPATIAILDSLHLPPQFSYKPYVPRKRNSVTPTANAVVVQYPKGGQIVHGDGVLSWSIDSAYPNEWLDIWALYDTPKPEQYIFQGYWGEILKVEFSTLDQPSVRGRLFQISGGFRVVDVVNKYQPGTTPYTCGCTDFGT